MRASVSPSPSAPEDGGSLVLRFGTAVGLSAVAALASALPAAARVSAALAGGDGMVRVWLALATAALGPMVAAVVALRGAREGLRSFGGPGGGLRAFGAALWLAWVFVALAVFGSVLRATTHHHALAGVTFACGAVAVAVGSAVVCGRIVSILEDAAPGTQRALFAGLVVITSVALGWVALRFVRAVAQDPASSTAAGTVLDVLAFAIAALFGSRRSFADRRALAIVGPPLAVLVAAVGLSTLHKPVLCDAIDEHAPAFAPVADMMRDR